MSPAFCAMMPREMVAVAVHDLLHSSIPFELALQLSERHEKHRTRMTPEIKYADIQVEAKSSMIR